MFGALLDVAKVSNDQKAGWITYSADFPTVFAQAGVLSLAVDNLKADPAASGLAVSEGAAKAQILKSIDDAQKAWVNLNLAKLADSMPLLFAQSSGLINYRGKVKEYEAAWRSAMGTANHYARVVYLGDIASQVQTVKDSIAARLNAQKQNEIAAASTAAAVGAAAEQKAAETNIAAIQKQQEQLLAQTDLEALAKQIAAPKIFGIPVAAFATVAVLGAGGWFGFKWWKKRKASKAAPLAGYRRRSRR